ncbi:MAG: ABC transporter permease [Pirellulaceae bacterium]|nr:ABC transporter permease [Pirellulaceae bacterium]MDP6556349.1 ABC transporter permease [Pirellulaceae bacterium]MDP6718868.1 ABC transporter permease [Pirellulaceae bacterium]
MSGIMLLARRYLAFYKVQTLIVVGCITATIYLPVVMHLLLADFQEQLTSRGESTPLVIGAAGSRFDLALHALYFETQPPRSISMQQVSDARASGLAVPIPLLVRQRARGFPIVGTTLDYFDFRQLQIRRGTTLVRLGDCVLGARVARQLGLEPGDRLLSDPENVFDIAGAYPLNMRVAGVLDETHAPDDNVVFVDLKTAWIIEGIGHGHQELGTVQPADDTGSGQRADDSNRVSNGVILKQTDREIIAGAALRHYTEITEDNLGSFHFHGQPQSFPLTAVIALPHDEKSETLLMGRYLADDQAAQILQPADIVNELLQMVFRAKQFFDLGTIVLIAVTAMFLTLVVLLSRRLRQREMRTLVKLGCSRHMIVGMQAAELSLVMLVSGLFAGALSVVTLAIAPSLLRIWMVVG